MRAFGKYRVIEPIASGGMAEVWRAEAPGPEGFVKEVALKVIAGDHDGSGEFVRMFAQEARLASRLAHPNIVQVFDFDQVEGRHFIAMELVRGRTLREVVDRCRERGLRFGLARAVHVCAEIARALAYAHQLQEGGRSAGLVHRDVSPQNVLLSFEGEVKLTDFGIARALGAAELTAPGTIKGKLAYMAPEQARGEIVDARADVFSLGVIAWELCTGRRLFARDSDAAILAALLSQEPISRPSAWNEVVPPELDDVVLSALERDPGRRAATAEDVAAALAALRFRVAGGHEDLDLRAFLRRLWPEATSAPRRAPEATSVRAWRDTAPTSVGDAEAPTATAARKTPLPRAVRPLRVALAALVASAVVCVALGALGSGTPAAARPAPAPAAARELAPAPPTGAAQAPLPPVRAPASGAVADPLPATAAVAASATAASSRPVIPEAPSDAPRLPRGEERGGPGAVASVGKSPRPSQLRRQELATGSVAVRAVPWAFVTIDGKDAGETPVDRALPARRHRLHARHPTLGEDDVVVDLVPGQRFIWRPALSR